jgi:hypothetical protein
MAEVDASIIGRLQPPKFDPLSLAAQANQLGALVLQNRLVSQQVGAKEALGRAVTGATGADGKTDWQKALGGLAGDPQGAFGVPELAGQVLDRQIKELQLSGEDLKLSSARWKKIGDTAGALMAGKDPLTRDAVVRALTDNLVAPGLMADEQSLKMLTGFVASLPTDDKGLRAKLREVGLQSDMTQERINLFLGALQNTDAGGNIVQTQTSQLGGPMEVRGAIEKGRTPSEKATLVPVFDPVTKTTKLVPSGALVGDAPGLPASVGQQGPALGQAEAAAGSAAAAVQQAKAVMDAAATAPATKAQIKNLRDQVGKFTSGPNASWFYRLNALATQFGLEVKDIRDETAAQEEFAKLSQQLIIQNTGQLGEGTDSKLNASLKATPNEFMSKEGVLGVLALMEGTEDAKLAQAAAWQKWKAAGNGEETYGAFQTQWNKFYNPRVFQSVYMSDAQRQNMLSKMSKADKERFQKDWTFAKKAGWLQ